MNGICSRFWVVFAAIAIIGSAIANRNDRDDHVSRGNTYYKPRSRTKHHGHKSHYKHGHGYHHKHGQRHVNKHKQHRNDRYTRPLPNRVQRKFLPASCRVQARTRRDNFLAYSNWCLDRKYKYARSLPRRCVVNARVMPSGRNSLVYANGCLSRYGYAAAPILNATGWHSDWGRAWPFPFALRWVL